MKKIIKQYSSLFQLDNEIINELINTKEMQRLKDISYYCGMYYGPKDIYDFKECYTRFDHSVNGCKIYYHLTKDIKGAIAFLFHDIATPVFSHVIDIMENDPINQESTEKYTKAIIKNSEEIKSILKKYKIKIDEVLDAKAYPVADNNRPGLCVDRIDNVFIDALIWNKKATINDIKYLFNNLKVFEINDTKEVGFNNIKQAKMFFDYALESAYATDDYNDTFAMTHLAFLVKILIDNKVITEEELYQLKELKIVKILKKNKLTKKLWKEFLNLKKKDIKTSNEKVKATYLYSTDCKRRYINPLVRIKGQIKRITTVNEESKKQLNKYLNTKRCKYVYWNKK